jgi:L-amino acid N-acyltransferase YncA
MLPEQIINYREMVTLKDGVHVLLRPMTKDDCSHLLELYNPIGDDDVRYLRENVKDETVLRNWCEKLNYSKNLPILALVKDRAVGNGLLHMYRGPKRHVGEVQIFLAKDYRMRGLGMKIINVLIEFARKQGLNTIVVEVIASKTKVVRAFEKLGFVSRCTLDDFFMLPDGECIDVVFMTKQLKLREDEF